MNAGTRPREYLIVNERGSQKTLRVIGVQDDTGLDSKFASIMQQTSAKLSERYTFDVYDVFPMVSAPRPADETYKASELSEIKW